MEPQGAERKLAAILSADAVDYSRLMAADEAATEPDGPSGPALSPADVDFDEAPGGPDASDDLDWGHE